MKKKRPIDLAKEFREEAIKSWREQYGALPLSGLKQFDCERTYYLSLKHGETPWQLFNIVMKYWKQLIQTHGDQITGIGNMISLIVAPPGEAFCSFRIARFPAMARETEAEMIPRVDRSVALFQAFANESERCTATIEEEKVLVCRDGRRFLLSECECCNEMTKEVCRKFKISE